MNTDQIASEAARKAFVDNADCVQKHEIWNMPPTLSFSEPDLQNTRKATRQDGKRVTVRKSYPAPAQAGDVNIGSKDTPFGTWKTGLNPHGDSIQGFADKIIADEEPRAAQESEE